MDQKQYEFIVGPNTPAHKPEVKHDERDQVAGIQMSKKRRSITVLVHSKGSMGSARNDGQ